jgi:hypothetical protein
MSFAPSAYSARAAASLIHPNVNLRSHMEVGADVMERGDDIRVAP